MRHDLQLVSREQVFCVGRGRQQVGLNDHIMNQILSGSDRVAAIEEGEDGSAFDKKLESSVDAFCGEPLDLRILFLQLSIKFVGDDAVIKFSFILLVGVR